MKKLADNKCWMVQNLRLTNYNLTSADSNVASDFDLRNSQIIQSESSDWCTDPDSTCFNKKSVYARNNDNGDLYNWYTATAGTNSSSYDICPKGGDDKTANDFAILDIAINPQAGNSAGTNRDNDGTSLANWQKNDSGYPNMNIPGRIWGTLASQDYGRFWSSSTSPSYPNEQASCFLLITSSNSVYPNNSMYKGGGNPIRCVAK